MREKKLGGLEEGSSSCPTSRYRAVDDLLRASIGPKTTTRQDIDCSKLELASANTTSSCVPCWCLYVFGDVGVLCCGDLQDRKPKGRYLCTARLAAGNPVEYGTFL